MTGLIVSYALGRSRSLFSHSWRIPHSQTVVRRISSSFLRSSQSKLTTTQKDKEVEEPEEPIKFTTSPAFRPVAASPNERPKKPPPFWAQEYIIHVSVCAFLLYFCVFREENDIDLKMKVDLGEPDAEEQLLELEKRGADVDLLREQLVRVRQIEVSMEESLPA